MKVHEGRSEANWFELVLSTHRAGGRDQIQTAKLDSKCLYLLSHLASPYFLYFFLRQDLW